MRCGIVAKMARLSNEANPSSQRRAGAKRQSGQYGANISVGLTTPSAPIGRLRTIFSLAQAPLFCKGGM
jgi:hypothetical protein